ncbi:MAG: transferrin receptor-like dimerization domain-containing protein, partial [Bryobacteraceae bacterium]
YGVYHSNYDTYAHYVRFEDPDFQYSLATVQLGGRMMLRLANAEVLPFRFENLAKTVAGYAKEVAKLADDMRQQTEFKNQQIRDGGLKIAADARRTYVVPAPREPVPFLNFAPLGNAVARLQTSVDAWSKADPTKLDATRAAALDAILMHAELALLNNDGLPKRPWYRHMLYAPGFYTGYDVKTLPGIREAIEQRDWRDVDTQIAHVAAALNALSSEIDRATAAAQ